MVELKLKAPDRVANDLQTQAEALGTSPDELAARYLAWGLLLDEVGPPSEELSDATLLNTACRILIRRADLTPHTLTQLTDAQRSDYLTGKAVRLIAAVTSMGLSRLDDYPEVEAELLRRAIGRAGELRSSH